MTSSDFFILPFSPTRFLIERFHDPKPVQPWNWIFRGLIVVWLVGLWFAGTGEGVRHWSFYLGWIALWLFPFSRINEIAIGFYKDAVQRYKGPPSRTKFTPIDRLELLAWAYFEAALQFGILYFCVLPKDCFNPAFHSVIDAIYFSTMTITTVGYGDIHPQSSAAKLTCIYELAVGFTVITFTLGSYLATSLNQPNA